jgi:hypothetical protein
MVCGNSRLLCATGHKTNIFYWLIRISSFELSFPRPTGLPDVVHRDLCALAKFVLTNNAATHGWDAYKSDKIIFCWRLTLPVPDYFENHIFSCMNFLFMYVCKEAPRSPKLSSNTVTDTFILKGINGASIGNAFECHGRRVRETRATGKCIFSEKAPI